MTEEAKRQRLFIGQRETKRFPMAHLGLIGHKNSADKIAADATENIDHSHTKPANQLLNVPANGHVDDQGQQQVKYSSVHSQQHTGGHGHATGGILRTTERCIDISLHRI